MNNIRLNTGMLYCMIPALLITNILATRIIFTDPNNDRIIQSNEGCEGDEFACDSTTAIKWFKPYDVFFRCIPSSRVCDGVLHCNDKTDENNTKCQDFKHTTVTNLDIPSSSETTSLSSSSSDELYDYI